MAAVRWALVLASAALAAGTWWHLALRGGTEQHAEDRFYCPMHPQIRASDPGTCPICFMTLEPIPSGGAPAADAASGPPVPDEPGLAPVMLTTERRQLSGIRTVAVRRGPIASEVRWPAAVEAREGARAEVRVRVEAFVEEVAVREPGVRVRAGQTLAWIYAPELLRAQEELLVARRWAASGGDAPLAASAEAARARLLLLGVSAGDIDAIVASGAPRRRLAIRAPIAGHITRAEAARGGRAEPGSVLYEIADLSRVRVVASAFAHEIGSLEGVTARFVPRGRSGAIALALELVEPALSSETHTARVRFLAESPDRALLPGEIGEVVIERPGRDALLVPRDAVIDTGTERYVFVERERGTFEAREVVLGARRGEDREITGGLAEGEVIVARGAFVLDSESRLRAALEPRHESDDESDESDDAAEEAP